MNAYTSLTNSGGYWNMPKRQKNWSIKERLTLFSKFAALFLCFFSSEALKASYYQQTELYWDRRRNLLIRGYYLRRESGMNNGTYGQLVSLVASCKVSFLRLTANQQFLTKGAMSFHVVTEFSLHGSKMHTLSLLIRYYAIWIEDLDRHNDLQSPYLNWSFDIMNRKILAHVIMHTCWASSILSIGKYQLFRPCKVTIDILALSNILTVWLYMGYLVTKQNKYLATLVSQVISHVSVSYYVFR